MNALQNLVELLGNSKVPFQVINGTSLQSCMLFPSISSVTGTAECSKQGWALRQGGRRRQKKTCITEHKVFHVQSGGSQKRGSDIWAQHGGNRLQTEKNPRSDRRLVLNKLSLFLTDRAQQEFEKFCIRPRKETLPPGSFEGCWRNPDAVRDRP